jgi:two-component system sensor histidine kinase FlrB
MNSSAQAVIPVSGNPQTTPALEQVFAQFNQVSDQLCQAWGDLESRVAHLSTELAAARSGRLRELAAKEALADKLSALMEAMPAGVVVIDRHGLIDEINPAGRALLTQAKTGGHWHNALTAAAPADGDPEFDTADGHRLTVTYSALGNGSRIAVLTDISESHRLRQLLQREQRLRELGDMAARLAHQLRTPLSAAMLHLAQLTNCDSAPRRTEVSARTLERLQQIERLIEGMLRYIRGAEEAFTPLCLAALIRDTAAALSPQMKRAGARLSLHYPAGGLMLSGQRELLENALSNLLDNALTMQVKAAEISVTLTADDDVARLSVTDNGPGVDPALVDRIFEPWFTTRDNGTGLGLAVVASAARAHGGEVAITRPENGGSRFTLTIPRHPQKESS